ncbi:sporulation-specific protein 1 [Candida albicans P94015]|nr:sporulation-specific protein 1 [Candida albicans P94015]
MRIIKDKKQTVPLDSPYISSSSPSSGQSSNYVLSKCIGRGNFGDVYRAQQVSTNRLVAIKVVNLDESPDDIKQIIKEIHFLSRLRNPYIIRYIESFSQEYNMYIVMEYCGGGSCSDLLKYHKKLPEEIVGYIIHRVLLGLQYLHQEHKVHRDIKSANILLTELGQVKLGDFGVSTEITMTKMKKNTFVGTPFWMAPEVITRAKLIEGNVKNCANSNGNYNGGNTGYNEKADIWSTGITTIELVTGSPPLSQYDPLKILFDIPKKRPPSLSGIDFSDNIKSFVKHCLIKEPDKRSSATALLRHKFFKACVTEDVQARLINLISLKIANDDHRAGYKPRFRISGKLDNGKENLEAPIEWEFTNTLIQQQKTTPRSPLLEEVDEFIDDSSSNYPSNVLEQNNMTSLKLISTKQHVTSRKCELLFNCLHMVQLRGKDEYTRCQVEKFIDSVCDFEEKNPGFCNAIVEELEKHI